MTPFGHADECLVRPDSTYLSEIVLNEQDRELQRRLRELLSVPERDRSDELWDEIIELEIQLAPGNRIDGSNPMRPQGKNMGGGGGGGRQGRSGGRQNRPRGPGGGGNGNPNPNQGAPGGQLPGAGGNPAPQGGPQGEGRPVGANRSKRRKPANKTPKPPTPSE